MKGITLSNVAGGLLVLLGLTVMVGWSLHIAEFATIFSDSSNIVFNSALGFFLAGIALLIPDTKARLQHYTSVTIGILIALLAGVSVSQNIIHYSAGIDQLFVHAWLIDQSPHPGRMADNSAIAFLFASLALIALPFIHRKIAAVLAQIGIFCVLILGCSALLGYELKLEILYNWSQHAHMSLPSAIGNTILGFGLWSIWSRKISHFSLHQGEENKKVISLIAIILVCVSLLIGSVLLTFPNQYDADFALMHQQFLPVFLVGIIVSLSLLLWQLAPLFRQIVRSERKLMEINSRLKESENRFRSAFDSAAIGMALISPQGKFLRVNQALCQILGYSEKELLMLDTNKIIHREEAKNNKSFIEDMLEGKVKKYQSVQRYFHKNGDIIWAAVNMSLICNEQHLPLYFITQLQNITTEKQAEEQLRLLAYHDPLTGLYNRHKLEQQMKKVLTELRHSEGFSVIFLDLDRFKNINDTIGHDAGDVLLKIVAKRLRNSVRESDLIARIGGDEFIVVLTELNKVDQIVNVVQKILKHLSQPIVLKGHEVYVTTSLGVSVYPYDGNNIETLMKNADLALYRAKEMGRNNYQFCTPEMTAKAREKMAKQNALVHALAKNEFVLYYQPKFDLKTRKVSGVEALLRWHTQEFKNTNALEIIQLAEETGLIIPLNDWVLRTACTEVKKWHVAGFTDLTLSVNLSPRQFKLSDFSDTILQTLKQTEFSAAKLELEITESLIMQNPEYISGILKTLKEHQINVAIDDFGTGYSSLDYLRRFSIDKIKIDKTFTQSITSSTSDSSVVTAMIAMAQQLGIKTLAEGVETKEQYEFLLKAKCAEAQGYYFSPPIPFDKMTEFLSKASAELNL